MTSWLDSTADARRPPREYSVVVSPRALALLAFAVLATLATLVIIDRASTVFVLLAAAITSAVVAAPAVRRLSRHMPRGAATVIVTLAGMALVVAVLSVVARDLRQQEAALRDALHQAVSDLPQDSTASDLADKLGVDDRIDEVLDGGTTRIIVGQDDPIAVAGEVGKVLVVGVLAAFMIGSGAHLVHAAVRLARRTSIREEVNEALNDAAARAGSFLRRTMVVSIVHGCIAALVVRLLDLPGPISLGAWVAMMSTVPILGGIVGWAPIVVLGWVADMSLPLLIALAAVVIIADRLARGHWVHRALRVGPFLTIVAIACGLSMVGVFGALPAMFFVAFAAGIASRRGHLGAAVSDLVSDPADRAVPNSLDIDPADVAADDPASAAVADLNAERVTSERRDGDRIVRLRLSGRTIASAATIVVAVVVVLSIASTVQPFIVWFAVAGFIAAGLDRPISGINRRWNVPRPAATSLMLGCAVAAVTAVIVIGGPSITDSTATIARDAPKTVRSMESLPFVGRILERNDAADKVEEFINSVPDRLRDSDIVDRVATAAGGGLVAAFWTIAIMLAILWDGPRLVAAIRDQVPARHRKRAIRFGRAAYTAVANVVAAAAFVAALNGSVVMTIAIALGVPLAPILGLWAAAWNFIPQIGGFVGAAPLVVLAFSRGPWHGVIALIVVVTYQTFENHVIQPLVGSRAVHLPPLVVMIGALFGGVVGGFAGAVVAGPVLGVAKIAADELRDDRRRIEDRIDHQPPGTVVAFDDHPRADDHATADAASRD